MAEPPKADELRATSPEIEATVELALRTRPWTSLAFVVSYQIRRWILTLWVAALCWAFSFPLALSVAVVAAASMADVIWIRRAYDLRIGHREFVIALAVPRRLGTYGRTEFRRFLVRSALLVIVVPVALLFLCYVAEFVVQERLADQIRSLFVLLISLPLTLAIAYASADGVHSFLGHYQGMPASHFVAVIVPADNLFWEDLVPRRFWINCQFLIATFITIVAAAIGVIGIRSLYLDSGSPFLALGVFVILYVIVAGYIYGFWLYRARLFIHLVRKAQKPTYQ